MNNNLENIVYKRRKKLLYLVQTAVLTGLIFLLAFTPIGFLKIGIVSITFLVIPVCVGAILMGPWVGAWLGFMMGITSLIQCFTGDAFGAFIFNLDPIMTILVCILPRILIGVVVGLLFKIFEKFILSKKKNHANKKAILLCSISSMVGSLVNTVLFVFALGILFIPYSDEIGGFVGNEFWAFVLSLITFNAIIEAGAALIVGGAIAFSVRAFVQKRVLGESA